MYKSRKTRLPNGCSIIAMPMPDRELATIMIGVKTGSRVDPPNRKGLAHLLEHMLFRRSAAYAGDSAMDRAIAKIGGLSNASTGPEMTWYWLRVPKAKAGEALKIVAAMVLKPKITPKSLLLEKRITFQELANEHNDVRSRANCLMEDLTFAGTDLHSGYAEYLENLNDYSIKDIRDFYRVWYHPGNMAVAILGGDTDRLIAQAAAIFGRLKAATAPAPWLPFMPQEPAQPYLHAKMEGSTMALRLAMRSVPLEHRDRIATQIVGKLLGNYDNRMSRLFQGLRKHAGYIYEVNSSSDHLSDAGIFEFYTLTLQPFAQAVMAQIISELQRAVREPFSALEIAMAKQALTTEVLALECNLEDLGVKLLMRELLFRKDFDLGQELDRIAECSEADIHRVAKQLFTRERRYLASVGPEPLPVITDVTSISRPPKAAMKKSNRKRP
jgi:predicted Zn-dependent peptidase